MDLRIDDNAGKGSYGRVTLISVLISTWMLGEGGSACWMFISGLLLTFCLENVVKRDSKARRWNLACTLLLLQLLQLLDRGPVLAERPHLLGHLNLRCGDLISSAQSVDQEFHCKQTAWRQRNCQKHPSR